MDGMEKCSICPRECGIDRRILTGGCGVKDKLRVARAALHFWEEPCISGTRGSGTVFFSGCSLRCVYCQNQEISRGMAGREISPERLTEIFFELEEKGANNINLVTADHFLPVIRKSVIAAKDQGIRIPFLLNTSSYLKVDLLKEMEGLIDLYLPDFKYIREEDSIRYSRAPGYPEIAKQAVSEMVRQQPKLEYGDDGAPEMLLRRGVIVRHLLLPGMLIQAKMIVRYLYETYGDRILISLMSQYTPDHSLLGEKFPEIDRKVTGREYGSLVDFARNLGITNGFVQEGEAADESFIPPFDETGVLRE